MTASTTYLASCSIVDPLSRCPRCSDTGVHYVVNSDTLGHPSSCRWCRSRLLCSPSTTSVPSDLLLRASRWSELKRWERRELGQDLRMLGLSYREIAEVVPVTRGTLSGWCRDVVLSSELQERLRKKRPAQAALIAAGARRRV